MRPVTQRIEASGYGKEITTRNQSQRSTNLLSPHTDRVIQTKTVSIRSGPSIQEQLKPTHIGSLSNMNNYKSHSEFIYSEQRQTFSSRDYFQQGSLRGSNRDHSPKVDFESSESSKQSESYQLRSMKLIITQKDKSIRDMTERLKIIMDQLDRYQIESKANQLYSQLMTDLSRMFQIPDISIEDIRIQVSILLEQRKSREHTSRLSQRKNVEEIQHLIDRLNSEINMKNILEIQLVDVNNTNTKLNSNVQELTETILKLQTEMKQLDDQLIIAKRQLEESNRSRKSGSDILSSQIKIVKVQHEKTVRQRDELYIQLRQLQTKLLDHHSGLLESESRLSQEVRKREFQQQQLKRSLELSSSRKDQLTNEYNDLSRQYKQVDHLRREFELTNTELKRQIDRMAQEKASLEIQLNQVMKSKNEIKSELISQQSRASQEYQQSITNFKESQLQLQNRLKMITQQGRTKNQEVLQYKLLKQRLQTQLVDKNSQIQQLIQSNNNSQQLRSHLDDRLQTLSIQIQQLRQSKGLQIEDRVRQINVWHQKYEELQRQLKFKEEQIQSMRKSHTFQQSILERTRLDIVQQSNTQRRQFQDQIQEWTQKVRTMNRQIEQLQMLINKMQYKLTQNQQTIVFLKQQINNKDKDNKQMKDMYEKIHQQSYNKMSLQFSTSNRELLASNEIQHQKKINEMSSVILQLQQQIRSNETIMNRLNHQLSSMKSDSIKFRQEKSINQSNVSGVSTHNRQNIGQKDTASQLKNNYSQILELKDQLNQKKILQQKLQQLQGILRERQETQNQMVQKFQAQIEQLKNQLYSRNEQITVLNGQHSDRTMTNSHLSVLHSQLSQAEELSRAQEARYLRSQGDYNQQMVQLKELHANTIKALETSHKESRDQLLRQLQQTTKQLQRVEEQSRNEKIQLESKLRSLVSQLQQRDVQVNKSRVQEPHLLQPLLQRHVVEINGLTQQVNQGVKTKQNLELQIKAYQQAVNRLQKQNVYQEQKLQAFKTQNLQSSFTKINDMTQSFEKQKQALSMSIHNKTLQIKTLESQNLQLKLQVASLKQIQTQNSGIRPRFVQYTNILEQKTHTMRQLQLENSTLTIRIDDLRKEMTSKEEKSYESIQQHKSSALTLQKQNTILINKVKAMEIKIDQLNFQLNTTKQLKLMPLAEPTSMDVIKRTTITSEKTVQRLSNTSKTQTALDVLKLKYSNPGFQSYTSSVYKESGYAIQQSMPSQVGAQSNRSGYGLGELNQPKVMKPLYPGFQSTINMTSMTEGLGANNQSPLRMALNTSNKSIKKDNSRESQSRLSPAQQRPKEQTNAYFSVQNKFTQKRISESSKVNNHKVAFYSPDKMYTTQLSPPVTLHTARSLQKDSKAFNYNRIYDQGLKTKQTPPLVSDIYNRSRYFSNEPIVTEPKTLVSPKYSSKINLGQFGVSQTIGYHSANPALSVASEQAEESRSNTQTQKPQIDKTDGQQGIHVYQKECCGSISPCC